MKEMVTVDKMKPVKIITVDKCVVLPVVDMLSARYIHNN